MNPKVPTPLPPEEIAKLPGIALLLRDVLLERIIEAFSGAEQHQKEMLIEALLKSLPPEQEHNLVRRLIQESRSESSTEGDAVEGK